GVAGFVLDAMVRDLDDFERMAMPVFARAVGVSRASKEGGAVVGGAVRVGGVTVRAGDVLIADRDGVAAIPSANPAQAGAALERTMAWEASLEDPARLVEVFRAGFDKATIERLPPDRG